MSIFKPVVKFLQVGESKKPSKPQEGVKLYEGVVQLLVELQQLQGIDNDKSFLGDVDLLSKIFKCFRCYYMALTCQGSRQWAEALALYQRAEVNQINSHSLQSAICMNLMDFMYSTTDLYNSSRAEIVD